MRNRQAGDTRVLIIEAARALFTEQGYPRTSVAAVAAAAGVALNTVYASVGGKPALVLALAESLTGDDNGPDADLVTIEATDDPREILRLTAISTGEATRRRLATVAVLLDNRTADPAVATAADLALRGSRERLARIGAHLHDCGAPLRPEITRERAEQVLWFYFGVEAWRTLRGFGWSWGGAGSWLTEQASAALLTPPAPTAPRP